MASIGTFEKLDDDSFVGEINTMSLSTMVRLVPVRRKATPKSPDYRLFAKRAEIGAAWCKTAETSGNAYLSVSLAAPELGPRAIYAALVAVEDPQEAKEVAAEAAGDPDPKAVHQLLWSPRAE